MTRARMHGAVAIEWLLVVALATVITVGLLKIAYPGAGAALRRIAECVSSDVCD